MDLTERLAQARKAMGQREKVAALTDGLRCHGGFDRGRRIDLTGVAAVLDLPDGRVAIKRHGFMPENGADRHEKSDRVPYKAWAQDGYCTLTPGDVTDNLYTNNWICQGERDHGWKVDEVDYDGHNATDLAIRMNEDRNREDFCVEVAQTCAGQNLAVKTFRELLLQDRVVLEESPLVLWCLQNAIEIQNNYGDLKLSDAFAMADNVLTIAAKSIAEIITVKGYVNVDFADVESVMRDSGVALMGAAEAEGEGRAMEALTNALISPLLNSNDIRGASNILLNMLYGEKEVTMDEISLITDSLREKVGRNVNVIWGTGKDETLGDKLRVAVIATGFNNNRGRATAATEQKIETATTTSAKKPYFKVEPLPDDLEMKVRNPAELEEEARLRRQKQEEERARKQKRESNRRVDRFERSQRGVNEVPDTNGWLKRKIGTLFSDEE